MATAATTRPGIGRLAARVLNSTLGLKYIMALTGVALVGFVFVHMLGNLQIFQSPEALNAYAINLRRFGALLWLARIGLLVAVALHIWSAAKLTRINRVARPDDYKGARRWRASSYAARTMRMSGIILLVFIVYHLLHLTLGVTDPAHYSAPVEGGHEVYNMVVYGFLNVPVALFYIFAQVLLGLHMSHGIGSMFQSLGWNNPQYRPILARGGATVAWAIAAGNILIPVAVLAGWVLPTV